MSRNQTKKIWNATTLTLILAMLLLVSFANAAVSTDQVNFSPKSQSGLVPDAPKVGSVTVGAQSPDPVARGSSATYLVTVNRGTGGGSSGSFSATLSITTTLPAGVTASFFPNPVSFTSGDTTLTSTLTMTTSLTSPAGTSGASWPFLSTAGSSQRRPYRPPSPTKP